MVLSDVSVGYVGEIKAVGGNEKIQKFLFTLGCSQGEQIGLVSKLSGNFIVNIKDSRYAIDKKMAQSIELV